MLRAGSLLLTIIKAPLSEVFRSLSGGFQLDNLFKFRRSTPTDDVSKLASRPSRRIVVLWPILRQSRAAAQHRQTMRLYIVVGASGALYNNK